jgi:membrane associated rhomboid family serine protease
MFVLYMFGGEVERAMGTKGFLRFYFITGIVAGLTGFIFAYNHSIIGASGAIFAVLVAFATFYPEAIVLFMFIFPMKAKHMVLLVGGMAFLATFSGGGDNIAHFAHLGGLVAGILYLHYGRLRSRFHFLDTDYFRRRKEEREWQIRQEVDRLLDKVHREGMGSLTKKEQKFLKEASRRFRSGE